MPVPYIFSAGAPVEASKVNDDFAYVLTSIQEAVEGASGELEADITNLNNQYQQTKNKVNALDGNVCKLTGTQTITGNKTFTGSVTVPNSSSPGTAIALADINKAASGFIKLGNGIIIQWGASLTANTTNPKVTFPTAFSTTNYFAMAYGRGTTHWDHTWGFKNSPTKTTCNFYIDNGDDYQWIAIGY